MNPFDGLAEAWGWWLAVPVFAASLSGASVVWAKLIRPVIHGIQILIDYAEYLQNEVTGSEDSLKSRLGGLDARLSTLDKGQTDLNDSMGSLSTRLNTLAEQVDGMDTTWSLWVFSHAREHAEVWAILARMGYERRHTDETPVYPVRKDPGDH